MANSDKNTALQYAARECNYWVAKLMIEEDPEPCKMTANESPLYVVTARRACQITRLSLDASLSLSSYKGPKGMCHTPNPIRKGVTQPSFHPKDAPSNHTRNSTLQKVPIDNVLTLLVANRET